MFHLHLHRALVFVDVESTGTDPAQDRLIELGLVRYAPGQPSRSLSLRCNPEVPIPPAATAVHGIRDEHVAACPPFRAVAASVTNWLHDADLAGFNLRRFDLPLLAAEFARVGQEFKVCGRCVVDALTIFHAREPRDLAAAVRRYCGRQHEGAHCALHDAAAAAAVLDGMLGHYPDLPRSVPELHREFTQGDVGGWFRHDDRGTVVFARGKYRAQPLRAVARFDQNYLHWLARQALLSDTRRLIAEALSSDHD